MSIIPYKVLTFETSLNEEEVRNRLRIHAEFSKTKSWFTATTDDFLIELKEERVGITVKRKFGGKRPFPVDITISFSTKTPMYVYVMIAPNPLGFVPVFILLLLFILFSPWQVTTFFFAAYYLIGMVGFGFDVWWVNDFLEKKALKMYRHD
jgi:hypothetical protein